MSRRQRAERFALRAARPRVLFVRPRSGLQACRSRGCLPPWRGECDVRPPEQVFYDFEYARRVVAILEQRPREAAGRGGAGRRRVADDARAGPQHGADAPGRTAGFGRPSRTGRAGRDEFYPLKGPSAGRMNGKRAPLFAESGNIVYFWGTFRKDAGVVELARLESE